MAFYYQSTAYRRGFYMFDSTTFASPIANAAPTVKISKAGASFIYAGGVTTEVPNFGYYTIGLTTGDTDTVGDLGFSISGTGVGVSLFVDQVLAGVQVATMLQTPKNELVHQTWATPVRITTSVASPVGVASNYDKDNYTLSTTAINAVGAQIVNAIWATPVRSLTAWDGIVSAVWATPIRALGTAGQTAVSQETTNAVWATPVRTLSQAAYDQLVNQVWATPVRTLSSAGSATVDTTAVIAIASGVWDQQRSLRNASGSFGNLVQTFGVTVATNSDKTAYTLTQAANDQIINAVWATPVRTITGGTITSVASPVAVASNYDKGNYTLSTTQVTVIADGLLERDMSAGTDSGSPTFRTPRQAFRASRNKVDLAGVVYKEDDTTSSWTFVVASDSNTTRITSVDPA